MTSDNEQSKKSKRIRPKRSATEKAGDLRSHMASEKATGQHLTNPTTPTSPSKAEPRGTLEEQRKVDVELKVAFNDLAAAGRRALETAKEWGLDEDDPRFPLIIHYETHRTMREKRPPETKPDDTDGENRRDDPIQTDDDAGQTGP